MTAPPTLETAIVVALVRQGTRRRHWGYVLADVVNNVMTLHRNEYGICMSCSGESGVPWPCDTVKVVAAGLGLKDGDWR